MTAQTRARYCLAMYALAIAIMAAIAVVGSVSVSAKSDSPRIDVSAMMADIDVGSLPVHNIRDAI